MPASEHETDNSRAFVLLFAAFQCLMILFYGLFVEYDDTVGPLHTDTEQPIQSIYPLFQDVHVMIFIGFGFLMTFLRKYSYGAVGLTFLVGAMCIQWGILVVNFWHHLFDDAPSMIQLDVADLVEGDFAAGAVLISFGAIIGRVTPTQLLSMAFIEIVFYGLNYGIIYHQGLADAGGTYVIHMFGAYFGLAVSRVLSARKPKQTGWEDNAAQYHSDVFAMIGTVFLWLYWPSFNGALAGDDTNARHRAIINTTLSISASAFMSFVASRLLRHGGKFNMVDVQNATLAGGVAMGASCNMLPQAWGSLLIGSVAGIISTFGFNVLQPRLERIVGLRDTCGIHNLHGMPSVFGAFVSVLLAGISSHDQYGGDAGFAAVFRSSTRSGRDQALVHLYSIGITLAIAISSGIATGLFLRSKLFNGVSRLYNDDQLWEVPAESEEQKQSQALRGQLRTHPSNRIVPQTNA